MKTSELIAVLSNNVDAVNKDQLKKTIGRCWDGAGYRRRSCFSSDHQTILMLGSSQPPNSSYGQKILRQCIGYGCSARRRAKRPLPAALPLPGLLACQSDAYALIGIR